MPDQIHVIKLIMHNGDVKKYARTHLVREMHVISTEAHFHCH